MSDPDDRLRDITGGGRRRGLIADDLETAALTRQSDHRLHEIRAVSTEDTRGTQDDVTFSGSANRPFALELRRSVMVQWCRRIVLDVRSALGTIEDIISRYMNQRNIQRGTFEQGSRDQCSVQFLLGDQLGGPE